MKTFLFPFSITGTARIEAADKADANTRYFRMHDHEVARLFGEPRFTYLDEIKEATDDKVKESAK